MLDLDAIFNPDRTPTAPGVRTVPVCGPDLRVEDLDPEWRVEWEERAAIMEFEGGLPRERAEAGALSDIAARIRRGERFAAGCSCPACRKGVGTLLTLSNQRLASDLVQDLFVTLLLLRLDPRTRSLLYSSAGHCPGYVLDCQGRTKAVLASTGYPLGIDSASEFPTGPGTTLEPGELVLLFTDGIVEAASPEGEQFGLGRTLTIVRAHQREAPDTILDALFHAVGDFSGHPPQDDLTAVILKAEGAG
jgi:hypothetical protein